MATLYSGIKEIRLHVKFLPLLIVCLLLSATCIAERFFVSPTGTSVASGSSWAEALDISTALKRASAGDEVWVLKGHYLLGTDADRTISFVIPGGVKVYGSFNGTENKIDDRTQEAVSVLSGEIGNKDFSADNAYTVVTMMSDADDFSILDGFVVTAGASRNFLEGLTEGNAGGGLYIMAGKKFANHMIVNCTFKNNKAHNGGAVMVDSGRPSFLNCTFVNNRADFNGGAVYNNGIASEASPIFRDCVFADNSSNSGAGMTNNGTNGSSTPLLLHCEFINNTSLMNGAAIYNITNDSGEAEPIIEGCEFTGNDSILGDDISGMGSTKSVVSEQRRPVQGQSLRPVRR
jgi:hypothetical protein